MQSSLISHTITTRLFPTFPINVSQNIQRVVFKMCPCCLKCGPQISSFKITIKLIKTQNLLSTHPTYPQSEPAF